MAVLPHLPKIMVADEGDGDGRESVYDAPNGSVRDYRPTWLSLINREATARIGVKFPPYKQTNLISDVVAGGPGAAAKNLAFIEWRNKVTAAHEIHKEAINALPADCTDYNYMGGWPE